MSKYKIELHGLENSPTLSSYDTMKLLQDYHKNQNNESKEKLIFGNIKLVLSLVQKYNKKERLEAMSLS